MNKLEFTTGFDPHFRRPTLTLAKGTSMSMLRDVFKLTHMSQDVEEGVQFFFPSAANFEKTRTMLISCGYRDVTLG